MDREALSFAAFINSRALGAPSVNPTADTVPSAARYTVTVFEAGLVL
jgi:hypothetical protein